MRGVVTGGFDLLGSNDTTDNKACLRLLQQVSNKKVFGECLSAAISSTFSPTFDFSEPSTVCVSRGRDNGDSLSPGLERLARLERTTTEKS
jgi:hypothetical protein